MARTPDKTSASSADKSSAKAVAQEHQADESKPIEQQLDALLASLNDTEPTATQTDSSQTPNSVTSSNSPTPQDHAKTAEADASNSEQTPPAGSEDLIGSELASQIQEMLDDAQKQQTLTAQKSNAKPAPADATQTKDAAPAGDTLDQSAIDAMTAEAANNDEIEGTFDSPDALIAAEDKANADAQAIADAAIAAMSAPAKPPAAEAHTEQAATPDAIRDLDEKLAEDADDAIAGDFESVNDVLAANAAPAAATPAKDPLDLAAAAIASIGAVAPAAPAAKPPAAAVAPAAKPIPPAAAKPPAPAAAPAGMGTTKGGFTASASDVARELDQQAKTDAKATAAAKAAKTETASKADAATKKSGSFLGSLGFLGNLFHELMVILRELDPIRNLHRACMLMNMPLLTLSPMARNTVGYIGLLTLFNASLLLLGRGTIINYLNSHVETPTAHVAEGEHEAPKEHGEASTKEKPKAESKEHGAAPSHEKPKAESNSHGSASAEKPKAESKEHGAASSKEKPKAEANSHGSASADKHKAEAKKPEAHGEH